MDIERRTREHLRLSLRISFQPGECSTVMERLHELLEESISLELGAAALYQLYSNVFPDDKGFWWKMAIEEQNHAALMKSGREYLKLGMLPDKAVFDHIPLIKKICIGLKKRLERWKEEPPSQRMAYFYAFGLENTACELHYQNLVTGSHEHPVLRIFRQLGSADIDHAGRILNLAQQHCLPFGAAGERGLLLKRSEAQGLRGP